MYTPCTADVVMYNYVHTYVPLILELLDTTCSLDIRNSERNRDMEWKNKGISLLSPCYPVLPYYT